MRFLVYTMGDDSVPSPPPSVEHMAEMGAFIEESTKSGVLVATGAVAPSAQATRVSYVNGTYSVTDGPFAEARELIGGWALIEVDSLEQAVASTKRFLSIVGEGESTIRQVFGPDDLPPGFDPSQLSATGA